MNDRIKLAEAMGWIEVAHPKGMKYKCWIDPRNSNRKVSDQQLPDPFEDANDDFSVLAWTRYSAGHDLTDYYYERFIIAMANNVWVPHRAPYHDQWWNYKIGDYARAALKVLEDE